MRAASSGALPRFDSDELTPWAVGTTLLDAKCKGVYRIRPWIYRDIRKQVERQLLNWHQLYLPILTTQNF